MKSYDPKNWFWYVGGDMTRAYSSALGDYVAVSDPAFKTWLEDGTRPTHIDSEASLGTVLAPFLLRPARQAALDGYLDAQVSALIEHISFKVLLNHENRIRTLEGRNPVTAAQARSAIKAIVSG